MFASIMAYSMVQHSLGIALMAKVIVSEVVEPICFTIDDLTRELKIRLTQTLTVMFCLLSICFAVSFAFVQNTMISLFFILNNSINSPILGLFFLSAFNPYANGVGAMMAFCSNLVFNWFLGIGSIVISRVKSQEFTPDTHLCGHEYHRNLSSLNVYDITHSIHHLINVTHPLESDFYPKNPTLYYLFSIAPIWYCLFSVLYTFLSGTLYSFAYSLIVSKSLDADQDFREERKKYLYYYKMFPKYFPTTVKSEPSA
jgi:hypothetical protein